jgi:hypothetical protein
MPFSLRLDPDTEAKIRRLATATNRSKSQVVREAVTQYAAEGQSATTAPASAFDRLEPFIGAIGTGGADYSTHTHRKYRELVRQKHRARRAR